MKEKSASTLADRLKQMETAAGAPLVAPAPAPVAQVPAVAPVEEVDMRMRPGPRPKKVTHSVFVRVPADLHEYLDGQAIARTKATGRGVTIQQIILEKLEAERGQA